MLITVRGKTFSHRDSAWTPFQRWGRPVELGYLSLFEDWAPVMQTGPEAKLTVCNLSYQQGLKLSCTDTMPCAFSWCWDAINTVSEEGCYFNRSLISFHTDGFNAGRTPDSESFLEKLRISTMRFYPVAGTVSKMMVGQVRCKNRQTADLVRKSVQTQQK